MKTLFTLINDGKVALEPKTKIIPKAAFSSVVSAKQIIAAAKEDAEKFRLDVAKECELLKEQAEKKGFEEGYAAWAKQIAALEEQAKNIRLEFERIVIPVALKAAKKIVGREIELAEGTIVDIVANALKAVSQHKKIVIYVNKKDLDTLESNRSRLRDIFEALESLVIRERGDIEPGGCIIETEAGIINAQLENQWQALESAFKSLMATKAS